VRAFLSSFPARLALTFAVTLVLVGTVQYALVSRDVESRLLDAGLERSASSARQIERAYDSVGVGESPLGETREAMSGIADGPGVSRVLLIDHHGTVVAATQPGLEGRRHGTSLTDEVRRTGEGWAGDDPNLPGHFEFLTPVEVPIGRLVLEVVEDSSGFSDQVASLRLQILKAMLVGFLLGMPLLYALGGASLSRRHQKAVERSSRDALTEVGNQRAFQVELGRTVAHARRAGEPLAIAVVDVDRFKEENDARGHQYGDEVLLGIAALMTEGRESDAAFRIGGDEFALLMPDTDLDGALLAAERLRAAATRMATPVSVSIGVAELAPGADAGALLRAADEALYEAKRGGRNAVAAAPRPQVRPAAAA
jgi:diguanylate cyclase (GGDEF)-like protein